MASNTLKQCYRALLESCYPLVHWYSLNLMHAFTCIVCESLQDSKDQHAVLKKFFKTVKIYHIITVLLKRNVASACMRTIANKTGVVHEWNTRHASFISGLNTRKWNVCHAPFIGYYSRASRCLLASTRNVALEQYLMCLLPRYQLTIVCHSAPDASKKEKRVF